VGNHHRCVAFTSCLLPSRLSISKIFAAQKLLKGITLPPFPSPFASSHPLHGSGHPDLYCAAGENWTEVRKLSQQDCLLSLAFLYCSPNLRRKFGTTRGSAQSTATSCPLTAENAFTINNAMSSSFSVVFGFAGAQGCPCP
jgi:hypothetical protein